MSVGIDLGTTNSLIADGTNRTPSLFPDNPDDLLNKQQIDPLAADTAFSAFMQRVQGEANRAMLGTSAFWSAQLGASLDELVSLNAREVFEQHIAGLLVHGWHPGHEMLLVAAADIFAWKEDRRRLYELGPAGAMLDRALEEHAIFSLQNEHARTQQSKLIVRLRNPAPPSASELLDNQAILARLQSNYAAWLAIITNVDAIARWQQACEDIPSWRRRRWPDGWFGKPKDAYEHQSIFSWKWLWVLLVFGLLRMCMQYSGDAPKPAPAQKQRQQQQSNGKPLLSGDYLRQGDAHLAKKEFDAAIASYNQVIALTPNNFMAWIGRGLAYLGTGDDLQAEQDFNQSALRDNDNHALHTARGKLAMYRDQPADAVAHYTRAIQMLPAGNTQLQLLALRAEAYDARGDGERGLADITAIIEGQPDAAATWYTQRMRMLIQLNRMAVADKEARMVLARFSDDGNVYRVVAGLYSSYNQRQKAWDVVERGIKAVPDDASLLLARARLRAPDDINGRRADLVRASKLAHDSIVLLEERVNLEIRAGRLAAAGDIVNQAHAQWSREQKDWPMVLALRGVITALRGERSAAEQDFSDALRAAPQAGQINNVCWIMATHKVSLLTALFICDQALALAPERVALLDSKALVLLQLGRNQDALAAYEAVLARQSQFAHAMMGRGIARQRLGDRAGGAADIKAALKTQPSLLQEYASYGVR